MRNAISKILLFGLVAALLPSNSATLNPSASKAYVDKKFADLRAELRENGVFTNTLQEIVNVYTNTYQTNLTYYVTMRTNVTVDVFSYTNETVNVNNVYTNTYMTNNSYFIYNYTTNTVHNEYTTNFNYNITTKSNVTVNVNNVTNFVTEITTNVYNTYQTNFTYNVQTNVYYTYQTNYTYTVTTNVDEYITNYVNVVTNNPVFPNPVSYTNSLSPVFGYTGIVITVSQWGESDVPAAYATNAIVFAPQADMANTYTNKDYTLALLSGINPMTYREGYWYAAYTNDLYQTAPFPTLHSSEYDDPSLNLNLNTSYEGESWATADSMTLLYYYSMFTDLAFILQRAEVESQNIEKRTIEYNQTIAAGYSDEARRLVSDGGLQWLDPTGVWWEVSSSYPVETYRVFEQSLIPVEPDTEYDQYEDARFTNANCVLTHSLMVDGDAYTSTWRLLANNPPLNLVNQDYTYEYHGLLPQVEFYNQQSEKIYVAYACTVYTNGVVGTNAVRRAVFDDDVSALKGALTSFDDKSVSTNQYGELEVKGFANAGQNMLPMKSGSGDVEWKTVDEIAVSIEAAVARNATWGYYDGKLYNCYVQVGRNVMSAGSGADNTITIPAGLTGACGVGLSYDHMTQTSSLTFGSVSELSVSNGYDAVVFVGTIVPGTRQYWYGIGSIPIIMVFE